MRRAFAPVERSERREHRLPLEAQKRAARRQGLASPDSVKPCRAALFVREAIGGRWKYVFCAGCGYQSRYQVRR